MRIFNKYSLFFLAVLSVSGCTTKKNTTITRSYHILTSRYNILFNGEESFKKGMLKLEENYKDDFSQTLPVFLYTKADILSTISPEMDRSINKASKLISSHSITVKPKIKSNKELNQKQKNFYSKKEYNKWIDEAYLLMGKAHFYKKEYGRAKETFNYLVANFSDTYSVFEAKLWLARSANEEGRYRESEDYLASLTKNLAFPKNLQGDLYATWADFYLKQGKNNDAIVSLKKSIDYTKRKAPRTRFTFLLAQLYSKTGENSLASDYYDKVIRMNPPYEMAFNAKINRALTYQSGELTRKNIEKQLQKMLSDDKNIDFQDQIFYAIGQLYYKDKAFTDAIKYYKMSLAASKENNPQRAQTNITLADLYYAQPDYLNAQSYYDSAVAIINIDYPNYQIIYAKSVSLTKLVKFITTVHFEDSVLNLANMNKAELTALIDDLIKKEIQNEEENRQKQLEAAQEIFDNTVINNQLTGSTGSNSWYFYNPTTKTLGHKDFIKLWGNRKLEDNWRRKNKSSVSLAELQTNEPQSTGEQQIIKSDKEKITNKHSYEFYLQNIPFSDSAKKESHKHISEGLFNMGEIYSDELKDYFQANKAFEDLLKRYPLNDNHLQIYYKLYTIAKNNRDADRVSIYQQKIINEFPGSTYAKLMTNPNYIEELKKQENQIYTYYEETLKLFQTGNYSNAKSRSEQAMKDYPGHALFSKFDYLYTISSGLSKDTLSFVIDMQNFISKYPQTELAENAQILINYLQKKHPEIIEKQNVVIARELYVQSFQEIHFFGYIVPAQINLNQLIFNVINYNIDNVDSLKLEVKKVGIGTKNNLCMVSLFKNSYEAMAYFRKITAYEGIFRDVERQGTIPVVISQTNFNKISETGKVEQYVIFFRENYK